MNRLRRAVVAASANSSDRWLVAWALGYAAVGAASLLVPLYAIALGGSPLVTGLVESTAGLAGVPGALVWGRLADRTGNRRGFVLLSLAGAGAVLAVVPLLASVEAVVVANAVLWFLVAAATPVVTLFVMESTPAAKWEPRVGLLNAYQRYGWVGGLLVGVAWLAVVPDLTGALAAQRWLFALCALASLAATPLSFYWLPPEATTSPARLSRSGDAVQRLVVGSARYVRLVPYAPGRALSALGRNPLGSVPASLRRYLVAVAVFSAAFAAFFGPVPAYLAGLGYADAAIFGLFIVSNLVSAVVFVPVGRRASAGDPATLQLVALGVRTALFPAVGLLGALPVVLRSAGLAAAFALVGLTWAVVAVTAVGLVSRAVPDAVRGQALGLYTALSGLGGGVGGVLGGAVAVAAGYRAAFALAGLLVLLAAGLLASGRHGGLPVPNRL